MNSDHQSNKLLILVGSPRHDGNSAALAEAARHGAETAGIAPSCCSWTTTSSIS